MRRSPLKNIDPKILYLHATSFYHVNEMLSNLDFDNDPQSAADVGPAYIVLSALTSELFLKCLICIETGEAQTGHHLSYLYGKLSQGTQTRIKEIWDNDLVKHRADHWDRLEAALGRKIDRNLLAALKGGDTTFEKMRYGTKTITTV
jgi:hypothetical protein